MKPLTAHQLPLIPAVAGLSTEVANYPRFRYMGSKFRLLPWIHDTLSDLPFTTATDAFSGSTTTSSHPTLTLPIHSKPTAAPQPLPQRPSATTAPLR